MCRHCITQKAQCHCGDTKISNYGQIKWICSQFYIITQTVEQAQKTLELIYLCRCRVQVFVIIF